MSEVTYPRFVEIDRNGIFKRCLKHLMGTRNSVLLLVESYKKDLI